MSKSHRSFKQQQIVDCKARTLGIKHATFYAGEFCGSEVVETVQRSFPNLDEVVPDSVADRIFTAACARKPGLVPHPLILNRARQAGPLEAIPPESKVRIAVVVGRKQLFLVAFSINFLADLFWQTNTGRRRK